MGGGPSAMRAINAGEESTEHPKFNLNLDSHTNTVLEKNSIFSHKLHTKKVTTQYL